MTQTQNHKRHLGAAMFAIGLGLSSMAAADTAPALSPEAAALIAPVHQAYVAVDARLAKLPPPANDRERLERLGEIDQAGRDAYGPLDLSHLPEAQRKAASDAIWAEINARDLANQQALKTMIPATGWFTKSQYGPKAAAAAFMIVQHAVNDPALMHMVLARIKPMLASGEADGQSYALLYDRVSLNFDHKPQLYGTQVKCVAGVWAPQTLEDPTHVDDRRKAIGMLHTEAEYLKVLSQALACK